MITVAKCIMSLEEAICVERAAKVASERLNAAARAAFVAWEQAQALRGTLETLVEQLSASPDLPQNEI